MQLQFRSNNTDGPDATRSAVKPEVPRDRVCAVGLAADGDRRPARPAGRHTRSVRHPLLTRHPPGATETMTPVRDHITVFLLDDHEIVRRGVADLLDAEDDIRVIGEAATQEEAVGRVHALDPDVAVLDVRLEHGNGIEACREIRSLHPRTACLILTAFADDEALFLAIMAGAAGYVLKQIRSSDLVDAVRRVAAGQSLLDPAVTARVLERIRSRAAPGRTDRPAQPSGTSGPRVARRRIDQPADRRAVVFGREDGQELRDLGAVQARDGSTDRGRRLRRPAPAARVGRLSRARQGPSALSRHPALSDDGRMRVDGAGLRVLTREECLAMLATAEVGRIGVSTRALPLIFPVCFAVDGDQIVISTQHGTTLDASTRDTVVAFEADGPSSHSSVGWSVQSTGIARHVTDPTELDRLAALALPSWSLKSPARFVTITTDQLSGRLAADTDVPFHHTHHQLSGNAIEA